MLITVKVTPNSKKNALKQEGELFKIYLTVPPIDGRANIALIRFLAEYFGVNVSAIDIVKGLKSRQKIVNINGI